MEKKSVVITPKGYSIKVAEHMLGDLAKFGATQTRKVIKEAPKELLKPIKAEPLPEMQITEAPKEVLPEAPKAEVAEVKTRKAPVRSKAKK